MKTAADFLIKKDMAGEFVDIEVGTHGPLAEIFRTRVNFEHLQQEILVLGCGRVDHLPALEG